MVYRKKGFGSQQVVGLRLNKWGCVMAHLPLPLSSSIPPRGSEMWYSASWQKKGLFHAWTMLSPLPHTPQWRTDTHWVSNNPPHPPPHTFTHIVSVFLPLENSLTSHCSLSVCVCVCVFERMGERLEREGGTVRESYSCEITCTPEQSDCTASTETPWAEETLAG